MRSINARLARLEKDVGIESDTLYWCEETETEIRFGGPLGCVILPRKDEPGIVVLVNHQDGVDKHLIGGIDYDDI